MRTKILWLSMFAPISKATSGGGQTFNYYFKQFIQDERFDIRIITCANYSEKEIVEKELAPIKHYAVYWGNPGDFKFKKLPNIESKLNILNRFAQLVSNSDVAEIEAVLRLYKVEGYQPQVVILEWTNMLMLSGIVKKYFPNACVVASEHDVTFIGYKRKVNYYSGIKKIIWQIKYLHEKRLELYNLRHCDLILPHNSDNIEILVELGIPKEKLLGLVPFYKDMTDTIRNSNNKDVLFFGAMSRPENSLSAKWFIDNVLPRIEDLGVRFVILGSNPPEYLKKLEKDNIHITGFVDSIEPYFSESMCLVAPLVLGAGIKIKVLEALSSGIPVLTNSVGIEGIPAENKKEFYYCVKPEEYEQIIRLIYAGKIDENQMEKDSKNFILNSFSYKKFSEVYRNKIAEMGELKFLK